MRFYDWEGDYPGVCSSLRRWLEAQALPSPLLWWHVGQLLFSAPFALGGRDSVSTPAVYSVFSP